ncbi:MAG TPA: ATP-binding protein [Alloacidobacterium sp.]|jgi:signal transduction histidine kinase|nr:ATP-binding protein [Alloacidobacterium sp.]
MSIPWQNLRSSRWKAIYIGILILLLAITIWLTPPRAVELHNILHHLNFLPFMIAGMIFGWRGAVWALLFATLVQTPTIVRHWTHWPMDAQDQVVELSIFGAAGIIAGFLSDRERIQRKRVEATKTELEHVYTELRQKIDQMKKAERLSAVGQLAASLAHEIRNPLASISGAAGILKRGHASQENTDECLGILEKESQRLNKLLTNFLDFARPRLPRYQPVNPGTLIESVASIARHSAILRDVELVIEEAKNIPAVECDAEQLKQVLLNLIINAVQATEGPGTVQIRSFVRQNRLQIEICDEGSGIAPEQQEKIFDPFFTTKENGTGLGLAIAANIIEQHGGTLSGTNNPEKGMTFRLELPITRPLKPGEATRAQ